MSKSIMKFVQRIQEIRGRGDMERTRNSRLNPLTLTCDLESR